MNNRSSFRLLCLALTAVLGAACAIDAQSYTAEGSFDRTLQAPGPVELDVRTGSGSIEVRTGPQGTVRVIGRIRARDGGSQLSARERVRRLEAEPPINQTGNTIRIGEIQEPALGDNTTISYEITVPIDSRVRSRSGSGSHLVEGVRGPVDSTAGLGDIRIGQAGGGVRVSTGSGDIEVHLAQTSQGEIDVVAGSGDITLTGAYGPLRLRASSGDIAVAGQPAGKWELATSSGDATVRLPANASFDLDARSSSGDIETSHPVTVQGGVLGRRRLHGQVRGGGARLEVTTSSGSIRIE